MVDWLSRQFGKSIQVTTPTLPSPFPALRAAGSSTRGRVWEGVKKEIIILKIKVGVHRFRVHRSGLPFFR